MQTRGDADRRTWKCTLPTIPQATALRFMSCTSEDHQNSAASVGNHAATHARLQADTKKARCCPMCVDIYKGPCRDAKGKRAFMHAPADAFGNSPSEQKHSRKSVDYCGAHFECASRFACFVLYGERALMTKRTYMTHHRIAFPVRLAV